MTRHLRYRCAVLGSPIAHSLSPTLHRAAYRAVGLDWSYQAYEVRRDGLAAFLEGLDETWRGLSLTKPLKRTVVPLVDELSDRARQAQTVNTVVFEDGRRIGHNTDIPGAVAAIRERHFGSVTSAIVLGGGATAASMLLALADLGCSRVSLVVREPSRATETLKAAARHPDAPTVDVRRFDDPIGEPADLLVSTIPASAQTAEVVALAAGVAAIFDVLYDPWPTPLAGYALTEGLPLTSGLDLLVHQAALQFTLMTGLADAPLTTMRRAGESKLLGGNQT